jgi:hypothetical protein
MKDIKLLRKKIEKYLIKLEKKKVKRRFDSEGHWQSDDCGLIQEENMLRASLFKQSS